MAALAAAVVYGAVKLVDYASGAKAAREALEGMAKTAKSWKETEADTFYSRSKGLSFFGMTEDDFKRETGSAKEWLNGVLGIWSDGKKETNEIISDWTESFKALTGSTRDSLNEMKETADAAGYLVLQILSFCSENERVNIKRRQAEGIAAARARGVHLGRPVKEVPPDFPEIVKAWETGELKLKEALKRCDMGETSFYRRLREYRIQHPKKAAPILDSAVQNP